MGMSRPFTVTPKLLVRGGNSLPIEVKSPAGTTLLLANSGGGMRIGISSGGNYGLSVGAVSDAVAAVVRIQPHESGTTGLLVRGISGQTGPLISLQRVDGVTMFGTDAFGRVEYGPNFTQAPVNMTAGSGAALPAQPLGYILATANNGFKIAIPYYPTDS